LDSRARLGDAFVVAGLKTAISLAVLGTGFRALSDDDFARIVIAERFAETPSFDPSGTSWLPFPFWLTGGVMAVSDRSVTVARVTAFALGIAAALLLWIAARWFGVERRAAILAAAIGSAFPYAAWLGIATIPEALTGALVLLGIASLSRSESRTRFLGALALAFGCLSRYEPWPVALIFAGYSGLDGIRQKKPAFLGAAALAVSGAIAWLVHGIVRHHDAFFFVKRVAAYRRAVGGSESSTFEAFLRYPLMVFRCEPEIAVLALVGIGGLVLAGKQGALSRYSRGAIALLGLLAFLVAGELRDGAPTHHAERALFAIWLLLAIVAADALFELARVPKYRARVALVAAGLVGLALFIVRPWYARRDSFIDRAAEIEIGRAAKQAARADERLAIDHPDFGFYAVIAGFGAPERAVAIDDHDPRSPRPNLDAPNAIRDRVSSERATLVVLTKAHQRAIEGEVLHEGARFVLVRPR
jgi:hypothetical protein